MLDLASGFLACGERVPAGNRVGICTSSAGPVWMADACAAAALEVPVLDDAIRASIDIHLPSYATSQNPVDSTAQGVQKLGYAKFARLVAQSPSVDGVIVVITARRSAFLEADLPKLKDLAASRGSPCSCGPHVAVPAYRRDSQRGGLPLIHQRPRLRAHAARDGRLWNFARAFAAPDRNRVSGRRGPRQCARHAGRVRPGAVRVPGTAGVGGLRHRRRRRGKASPLRGRGRCGRAGDRTSRGAQGSVADVPHKTEARAVALDLAGADTIRSAYDRVLTAARQHAPAAHIDGVLVQPMAPPRARDHCRRQPRCDFGGCC